MSRRFSFFPKKVKAPEPMLLPAGTAIITPYGAGMVDSIAGGIYKINLTWFLAQGQPAVLHANAADVECGTIANSAGTFVHRYRPAASRKLAAGAPITTPFGAGVVERLSDDGSQYAIALDWTLAQGQHALLHACAADVESGEGTANSSYGFAHEHTEEKTSELSPGTPILTPYGSGVVRSLAGGTYVIALKWHLAQGQCALLHAAQADVESGDGPFGSEGIFVHQNTDHAAKEAAATGGAAVAAAAAATEAPKKRGSCVIS